MRWEQSYVAASILLGEDREAVVASVSDAVAPRVRDILAPLAAPSKVERASALARLVHELSVAYAPEGLS